LNENTRYLGGACRAGCVPEIVDACTKNGLGIVQMPCPEQRVWGGVLKRHLLSVYGAERAHPLAYRMRGPLRFVGLWYTRLAFQRLASRVAKEVADYEASGFSVSAIVGVDGSPSCGVATTIDPACLEGLAALDPQTITADEQNETIRRFAVAGRGVFVAELERELFRRGLSVRLLAHDLLAEQSGESSPLALVTQGRDP
jgi:hypothetical protein